MLIKIDSRETELYKECQTYLINNPKLNLLNIKSCNLPIGDVILYNDTGAELIIIERKTMNDLAASIRDSRYKEQSYRLNQCSLHNHNIFYLLEGHFSSLDSRYNKNTLLSAMVSLSYTKGFSTYRTVDIKESAEWIIRFAEKLNRIKDPPFYIEPFVNNKNECKKRKLTIIDNYSSVVKRVKKNNITQDNIGEIMLMQIPGVSQISANVIMNKYKTIQNLIFALSESNSILDEIEFISNVNCSKKKKLNKTCKSNIYRYLLRRNGKYAS